MKMTVILTGVACALFSFMPMTSWATIYWTPAHEGPGFPPGEYGNGIELADLDADGDADLLLAIGVGQNLLYLNDGVVPVEPTSWGAIKALYR